jgi:hypothetical protein
MNSLPKIEFEIEKFIEDDNDWDALFVSINDGPWHLAKSTYNTEDKDHIIELIKKHDISN